jgi:hypothetical protein
MLGYGAVGKSKRWVRTKGKSLLDRHCRGSRGNNDIDLAPHELGGDLAGAVAAPLGSGPRARYSGLPNSQGFANHV